MTLYMEHLTRHILGELDNSDLRRLLELVIHEGHERGFPAYWEESPEIKWESRRRNAGYGDST